MARSLSGRRMIREIQAKTLLSGARHPDRWFGIKYTMNPYRGCEHQCIYCDSRSECYQIEDFSDILVKTNAIDLLRTELAAKRARGVVGTGSMHDPYMPAERRFNLTGRALGVIAQFGFPVHVITKSDLVLRDLDTLRAINRICAAVTFTITTLEDSLAQKLEPGAPPSSARFAAMKTLADQGILTGVALMPVLPFIEDNEDNLLGIVARAQACGATYIIPALGVTLRDRQRAYFYTQLDRLFPGLREKYEKHYGDRYDCAVNHARGLDRALRTRCRELGVATSILPYLPRSATQPRLL